MIRLNTPAGLEAFSSDRIGASGSPVLAACWYAAHSSGANRPHAPPFRPEAEAKSSPAHSFLNTPGWPPAAFGNNAFDKSFQVMSAPTASTRLSLAPNNSASPPP